MGGLSRRAITRYWPDECDAAHVLVEDPKQACYTRLDLGAFTGVEAEQFTGGTMNTEGTIKIVV